MTEPTTVHMVVAGEYSDFHVIGLFADPDDAAALAATVSLGQVRPMPVYAPGDRQLRHRNTWSALVAISASGRIGPVRCESHGTDVADDTPSVDVERLSPGRCPRDAWVEDAAWGVWVTSDTEERARKVAGEQAAIVAARVVEGLDPMAVQP